MMQRPWLLFLGISLIFLGYIIPQKAIAQLNLDQEINIHLVEVKLDSALDQISDQSGIPFSYNAAIVPENQLFTLSENRKTVKYILGALFLGTALEYKIIEDQIIILKAPRQEDPEEPVIPQVGIFGVVKNSATREFIEGVNIFLSRTMLGDASDQNGFYNIRKVPFGTYEVIFSHVGYKIATQFITIDETKDYVLNIELEPKTSQLEEVEITARFDKSWERHFHKFEAQFLGSSPNSSRCFILNPQVLDFTYDEETDLFQAFADDVIIIENQALGYRIEYLLELFEHQNGKTRFVGKPKFQEVSSDDNMEKKRWRKAREKSYRGSLAHFIKSMADGRTRKEGFRVYKLQNLPVSSAQAIRTQVNPDKLIAAGDFFFERKLSFRDFLQVVYTKENESQAYVEETTMLAQREKNNVSAIINQQLMSGNTSKPQTSYIKLNIDPVSVDARGFIYDPLAVTTYGYWSWERVAESLPFEYEP